MDAGGMLVRRDALPETPGAGKHPRARSRSWGKKNVGHSYKTGNSVGGRGYTEKDLAAVVAACFGMQASSAEASGVMDEQSSSGYRGLGGLLFWGAAGRPLLSIVSASGPMV